MQEGTQVIAPPQIRRRSFRKSAKSLWRFMRTKPLGGVGVVIIVATLFVALFADVLAPYDPLRINARDRLQAPSAQHFFGTDVTGKDVYSRVILGTRISLLVGVVAMLLSSAIGAFTGITSAFFGKTYDLITQRIVDALIAFPSLLLAMALIAGFGSSLWVVIWALVITSAPRASRVIRSAALSIKEMPYVEASRAIGAPGPRIMLQHILPNTFAPLIIISSASVGTLIVAEASLSFLGVGTPAHLVSWGSMLSGDTQAYFASAPWIGIFPGAALSLVVFGMSVLGDSLRDVLDPRLRGR